MPCHKGPCPHPTADRYAYPVPSEYPGSTSATAPGNLKNDHSGRCVGIANGVAGIWDRATDTDQWWHQGECHPTYTSYRGPSAVWPGSGSWRPPNRRTTTPRSRSVPTEP